MARTVTPRSAARRGLIGLVVLVLVLIALNAVGVLVSPAKTFAGKAESFVPQLGLDLVGGTQVILEAKPEGGGTATSDQLTQSVSIIRQRVAASGNPDAQISTSGADNIIVSLPGTPSQATLNSVRASARMDFRPVLATTAAATSSVGGKTQYTPPASLSNVPSVKATNGSDLSQVTPYLAALYTNYNCAAPNENGDAPAAKPLVTCSDDGTIKYLLGPVAVKGSDISNATAGLVTTSQGSTTGTWAVNLSFNSEGTTDFGDVSTRLVALTGAQNQFGIVLDGRVISAPAVQGASTNGQTQITGSFTADSAKALADQLKFGSLPVNFAVQSQNTISATLGSSQLQAGLIAGLIGFALVIAYAMFQYRALGGVVIGSLLVGAVLTYLVIDFLSWREGYRLSLAGVTGLIISIGITADSFIVYFERIRDELREGRALQGAVEAGWRRAIRTILASDAVNLLAASVLFALAVGDVRGFALTLGLSVFIDVAVVALFTHPLLLLISKVPFFAEGHVLSGLDPRALGAVYRGRGQFRAPTAGGAAALRSRGEAVRRQTIAERKAAIESGDEKAGE